MPVGFGLTASRSIRSAVPENHIRPAQLQFPPSMPSSDYTTEDIYDYFLIPFVSYLGLF